MGLSAFEGKPAKAIDKLRKYDVFRTMPRDLVETTSSGAILTFVACFVCSLFAFHLKVRFYPPNQPQAKNIFSLVTIVTYWKRTNSEFGSQRNQFENQR